MTPLSDHPHLLLPDWPAPESVRAVVTLRTGGVSLPPYDGLNLGDHVGDRPRDVEANRERLGQWLGLAPERLQWLRQVHGTRLVEAVSGGPVLEADAVTTAQPGLGCVVMTADCLPVFFCDQAGTRVAVAHAGWRGLLAGVLESALSAFADASEVLAWLGPAIGPCHFEVGQEVRDAFLVSDPEAANHFQPSPGRAGHWYADLYGLASLRLRRRGVLRIHGGGFCTYHESQRFYSFRRDGATGRMASVIWLDS